MSTCFLCHRPAGTFSKVRMDWLVFCRACAPKWREERNALAIATLSRGGPPRRLFSIPRSVFIAPEAPQGRVRLAGSLAFTDKGICFVAVSRTLKTGWWPIWLAPLGCGVPVIVFLILDSNAKAEAKRAYLHGELMVLEGALDFSEVLLNAPQLIVVPREEIREIRFGHGTVRVRWGTRKLVFGIPGDKGTRSAYQPLVADYARVLESGGQFKIPTGPPALPTSR